MTEYEDDYEERAPQEAIPSPYIPRCPDCGQKLIQVPIADTCENCGYFVFYG